MKAITKVNEGIEKIFITAAVILLIVFSSIVFLQIVFRNVFKISMMWSIEVALICFMWSVFLGAAVGLRYRRHYTVELFPERFVKTNLILDIISHLVVCVLIYIFVYHGYQYAVIGFSKMSTSIAIPQGYLFASLPIGGVAMGLFTIELLLNDIRKLIQLTRGGNM